MRGPGNRQNGYVLPAVLFLLFCSIAWGSVMLTTVTDLAVATGQRVEREQSRMLAASGWNMAMDQLQHGGNTAAIERQTEAGLLSVTMELTAAPKAFTTVAITATGQARFHEKVITGQVLCKSFPHCPPLAEDGEALSLWPQQLGEAPNPSLPRQLFWVQAPTALPEGSYGKLAIASRAGTPVQVIIDNPVKADGLYIDGDLVVHQSLDVAELYVSGAISGQEAYLEGLLPTAMDHDSRMHWIEVTERDL